MKGISILAQDHGGYIYIYAVGQNGHLGTESHGGGMTSVEGGE